MVRFGHCRPDPRHRGDRYRTGAGRPGDRRKGAQSLPPPASAGDKEAKISAPCSKVLRAARPGQAGARARSVQGRMAQPQTFLPDHRQAGAYAANVAETAFENNPHLDAVRAHAAAEKAEVVAVCAAIEAEIADLRGTTKTDFRRPDLRRAGSRSPDHARLSPLGLQTYFTAGVKGSARVDDPQGRYRAAGRRRHSHRFRRGFIRAQTIASPTSSPTAGEQGAKEAGKMRAEGKEYVVQDGDAQLPLQRSVVSSLAMNPPDRPCGGHKHRGRRHRRPGAAAFRIAPSPPSAVILDAGTWRRMAGASRTSMGTHGAGCRRWHPAHAGRVRFRVGRRSPGSEPTARCSTTRRSSV